MIDQPDLFDAEAATNPIPLEVYTHFERLALQVIDRGFEHYSADAILHRIRWHMHIDKGRREFKCNNNWTPRLARWFHAKHPIHHGFFRNRKSKEDVSTGTPA